MVFKRIAVLLFWLIFLWACRGIVGENVFGQIPITSDTANVDTLYFLNGEERAVKVIDTIPGMVRFLPVRPKVPAPSTGGEKKAKKSRVHEVETSRIFSVKFSNGQERILYFHDSAVGNVFTVLEAKMFMLGEQEADAHYRNKWPFIIGFMTGIVSPIALSNAVALSPIPPAITSLHTLIPVIKVNTKKIENRNYLQYDTYLMGYEKVARKKNFMRGLIGAGTGLAMGIGIWAVLK